MRRHGKAGGSVGFDLFGHGARYSAACCAAEVAAGLKGFFA
jgi:hypothetical protein